VAYLKFYLTVGKKPFKPGQAATLQEDINVGRHLRSQRLKDHNCKALSHVKK